MKKIMFLLSVVMAGSFGLFAMQRGPGAARVLFADEGSDNDSGYATDDEAAEAPLDAYDALGDDLRTALEADPLCATTIEQTLKKIIDTAENGDLGAVMQTIISAYIAADADDRIVFYGSDDEPFVALNAQALRNALQLLWARNQLPEGFAQEFVVQNTALLCSQIDMQTVIKILDLLPRVAPFLFRRLGQDEAVALLCAASAARSAASKPRVVKRYYVTFLKDGLTFGYLDAAKDRALSLYCEEFIKKFPIAASGSLKKRQKFLDPLCHALRRWAVDADNGVLLARAIAFICSQMSGFAGNYKDFFNLLKLVALNAPEVLHGADLKKDLEAYINNANEDAPMRLELMDFAKTHKIMRHHRHSRAD